MNEEGHAASRSDACLRRSRRRKRRRSRRRKVYSGANAVNKKDPERDRATLTGVEDETLMRPRRTLRGASHR